MAIYARKNLVITDEAGDIVNGATVTVQRDVAGFPLVQLYSDRNGANALGNPFVAADGADAGFHAAGGAYKITATKGGFTRTWRYEAVGRAAESDLAAVPDVTVDNTVPRFDGTGGAIQTSGVTIDDSNRVTAAALIPSGSSAPTNGMYLPSANTVGFSTNGSGKMQIDANGNAGIPTAATGVGLRVNKQLTGSTISYGLQSTGIIQSDATAAGIYFRTAAATAATSFTCAEVYHYSAAQSTFGAGSTVTTQYGFQANSSLTGAGTNYGFYGGLAAASGRWNFYAAGTARNYFAGQLSIGSTTDPGAGNLSVTGAFQAGSFTVATLPSGTTGQTVYCSNCRVFNGAGTQEGAGAGTGGHVTYNGSAWKIAGTNITAVA